MSSSRSEVYLHLVWATKLRQPKITCELEAGLFEVIREQIHTCDCQVIALNGTEDHVHLLIRYGRETSLSELMNRVKGVSSRWMNAQIPKQAPDDLPTFAWQPGYGVFSLGFNQVKAAKAYVCRQKERHALGKTWDYFEQVPDETVPMHTKSRKAKLQTMTNNESKEHK